MKILSNDTKDILEHKSSSTLSLYATLQKLQPRIPVHTYFPLRSKRFEMKGHARISDYFSISASRTSD